MRRTVLMSLVTVVCVLVTGFGQASAQGSDTGPGNPTLLRAIQNLQNSVNTLQSTVNDLQSTVNNVKTTVNNIVTNGVSATPRQFYLTKENHQGNTTLTACATGFHMASLWEIFDPSNLTYDTSLGAIAADSGQGPPNNNLGWIRTGFDSATNIGAAGEANCAAWTTNANASNGTFAGLDVTWFFSAGTRTDPWFGSTASCDFAKPVWCVADSH